MYKWVLTHEVSPGKLQDMRAWFIQQDEERKKTQPDFPRVKRYTTVFGSVHQVSIEVETEKITEDLWQWGWGSGYATIPAEGPQGEFLSMIVPGRTELRLLKEMRVGPQQPDPSGDEGPKYKVVLCREVLPGKLAELERWGVELDKERKQQDPSYGSVKRYTTIFGSVHQVISELGSATVPEVFLERSLAEERSSNGTQGAPLHLLVPGRTSLSLWKNLI